MTKIVDVAFLGNSEYEVTVVEDSDIRSYLNNIKQEYSEYEMDTDWFCIEVKTGWLYYGFAGSEITGICRTIDDSEVDLYENMSEDQLEEIGNEVIEMAF